eukprot:CAMPEP_0198733668 /NCGR_PEP_ID=MMETSP1475-20131203/47417_1 /TAXON_ID= ORGANISM="Unidentified sp., Strain CCMP1999" /NCGR_SAMPLE_ID=MMETSP1475 /ASSEMBLY_ACC=CAM_ASM_001111 /LENGTH=775 /DNA_ID=CAMNT_0044497001 /DNA_START=14 /DNA_END=2341 /DNA_ORIENTATION=-
MTVGRVNACLGRAADVGAAFDGTAGAKQKRALSNRVASVGDSLVVYLDDRNDLYYVDVGATGSAGRLALSQELSDDVDAIVTSPGQRLLLVYGRESLFVIEVSVSSMRMSHPLTTHRLEEPISPLRPELRVLSAKWNPRVDGHLLVLLSNSTLYMYDVAKSLKEEEQRISLGQLNSKLVDFCFGSASAFGWNPFAVYLVTERGSLYVVCPVAPCGMTVSRKLIQALSREATAALEENNEEDEDMEGIDDTIDIPNESFMTDPSLSTRARKRLEFLRDRNTSAILAAGSVPWAERQCMLQLEWIRECVYIRNDSSERASVLKSRADGLPVPLVQGPIFTSSRDAEERQGKCTQIVLVESYPTVLFRSFTDGTIDVLLALEEVEARWQLARHDPTEEVGDRKDDNTDSELAEDRQAAEDAAPGMLLFERVELPTPSPSLNYMFVPHSSQSKEFLFISSAAGLLCLRMPWLTIFEAGDPSNVSDAPSSVLSALVAAGSSPLLGGTTVFTVPEGVVGIVLTSHGTLVAATTAKSVRDWGMACLPPVIPRPKLKQTEPGQNLSNYERRLASIIQSLHPTPRMSMDSLDKLNSVQIYKFIQQRVFDMHDNQFRAFAQLHELVAERSKQCLEKTVEQHDKVQELREAVEEKLGNFHTAESKFERSMRLQDNLLQRMRVLKQVINDGSTRLSRAERRFTEDCRRRRGELEDIAQKIAELRTASERIIAEAKDKKVAQRRPLLHIRTSDQTKIHEALSEHSKAIAKTNEKNAELWNLLKRQALA